MAGSFLLVSLAPTLPILTLAIALWGVTASVYHPAGLALISTSVDRRGTALGYHGIGGNLGIALGPLATALLLLAFDWEVVAALLAVPALLVAGYGATVDVGEESAESGRGGSDTDTTAMTLHSVVGDTRALMAGGFVLVLAFAVSSGLYYRTFLTFLPDLLGDVLSGLVDVQLIDPESPYAEEFDLARYLYVAVLTVGVFGQYLGGRIADRVRPERGLIGLMSVLAALALLFAPASETTAAFLAVSLLLGVALFTVQPLSQATVAAYSPPDSRGLSFGFTYLAIFGVGSLGAALAGTVLTRAGPDELFVVLAGIATVGALCATAVVRLATRRD